MAQWIQLSDRLWELRHISHVLATIYHQPSDGKYSLYIAIPIQSLYATKINVIGRTNVYKEMEGAQKAAIGIMRDKLLPWFTTMKEYLDNA